MLYLVRLFLTLHITISFFQCNLQTIIFSVNNGYNYGFDYTIYPNAAVIMTMAIVVIKKFTHYMSVATKTMIKFLKSFKKDNFCCFFKMIKEHKV